MPGTITDERLGIEQEIHSFATQPERIGKGRVEVVTDPEGSGITGSPCSASGWCEIGDVCETSTGIVNGIAVQAYWSEQAKACVVPGST